MTDLGKLFDSYGRQARLYPALITLSPAIVCALVSFPALLNGNIGGEIVGLAGGCGLVFLLADISRRAGKRIEPSLLKRWGGWPTTVLLRHRSRDLNDVSKRRYHAFLAANVPDITFPTSEIEQEDEAVADLAFASAVHWLKEQCRGDTYTQVLRENTVYGFRRNMLGLKPVALFISALSSIALLSIAWAATPLPPPNWTVRVGHSTATFPVSFWLGGASIIAATAFWICVVRAQWAREAANIYAVTLLACCDNLPDRRRIAV